MMYDSNSRYFASLRWRKFPAPASSGARTPRDGTDVLLTYLRTGLPSV
jgi:hypothetical protein